MPNRASGLAASAFSHPSRAQPSASRTRARSRPCGGAPPVVYLGDRIGLLCRLGSMFRQHALKRLDRQRRLLNRLCLLTLGSRARPVAEPVHREGGSPCKSAVTEFTHPTRYGATGYDRLRPGITGQSRHFLIERTGCDPLRPAAARQSLCGTCVVDVMPVATTSAVTERMRHACLADGTIIATSHFVIRVGRRIYRGGNCRNSVAIRDASRCLVRQQNDCLFRLVVPRPVPYTP